MGVRKAFVCPADLAYNAVLPRADRTLDILVWEAPNERRVGVRSYAELGRKEIVLLVIAMLAHKVYGWQIEWVSTG
jgi:hypothetical protein